MRAPRVPEPTAEVCIVPDAAALSREAARRFVALAQQSVCARGRFTVALAGGTTAQLLHARLAEEPYRRAIPWAGAYLFWGDERCVPTEDPASNFRRAHDALLSRVPIPSEQIHRVPVEQGVPDAIALAYERTLRNFFALEERTAPAFDLVCLGLGTDGHTASLFPHSDALRERSRWVLATVGGMPRRPRVTLTIPVLNRARHLVWLVAGSQKADIVRAVLEGPESPDGLPAQHIRPMRAVPLWLIDRAAARRLTAGHRQRVAA